MIATVLIQNALIVAVCFAALWLIALKLRDVSFIDSWWALGMVVLAWSSFFGTGAPNLRKLLLVGLCSLWGLRLGLYLVWRWRRNGVKSCQTTNPFSATRGQISLVSEATSAS